MPELPDVEVFRRHLARTALHRRIAGVTVLDDTVVRGVPAQRLDRELTGTELGSTRRHGKHLFVLGDGPTLELHFGMTGYVRARDDIEPAPDRTRVTLHLEHGGALDFVDQRKLGTVTLVRDFDERISEAGLGPDAMDVDRAVLGRLLAGSRGGLVATLMDQGVLAGLGNIYSDEVLFHARLDPRLPAAGLSAGGLARLHRQLRRVLGRAVAAHALPGGMPRGWLIHARDDGAPCPRGIGEVRRYSAAGRHAYWCPACQEDRC